MANQAQGGQSPINVTKHLGGMDFPADKEDLVKHAEQGGADKDAIEMLKKLPDKKYENMADVMKGYGKAH